MSNTGTPPPAPAPMTGFDLWTPNDYSNFITISAAAIGTTLLVLFKSRCVKISMCWGLWSCDRQVQDDDEEKPPENPDMDRPPPETIRPQPETNIPPPVQSSSAIVSETEIVRP